MLVKGVTGEWATAQPSDDQAGRGWTLLKQAEERLDKGISQFKWIHWESASTLADTQNSGLVTFWKKDRFNMVAKYELEQRVLVTVLQDDDRVQWTIVNVHFHNDAGPRRLQWTMIKEKA